MKKSVGNSSPSPSIGNRQSEIGNSSVLYTKGQKIQVTISDAAEEEKCFARMPDGIGVFIRGQVAVGDQVEAEVYKVKKKFLEARFTKLIAPSPNRAEPACAHFGLCGGCKWQHVTYEEQLRIKQKKIVDALTRLGGLENPPVQATIPAKNTYGYRNKLDFSFSDKRYLLEEELGQENESLLKSMHFALGFHVPRQFAKVLDVDQCHIATDDMNTVLRVVKAFGLHRELTCLSAKTHSGFLRNLVVRQASFTGELMVNLVTPVYDETLMQALLVDLQEALGGKLTTLVNNISTRQNNSAFGEEEHVVFGPGVIKERLGERVFEISANSFFQTNSVQAVELYGAIAQMAAVKATDIVYDLYSGTGSISLFMANNLKKALGLECVESAVADAMRNAKLNEVENCTFRALDMKDLKKVRKDLEAFGLPNVIITDPPRAGMHPKALAEMLELGAERIVFVSCNPSSLARDGKAIVEDGRYELVDVRPIDMFPHTNHIESVALFNRLEG